MDGKKFQKRKKTFRLKMKSPELLNGILSNALKEGNLDRKLAEYQFVNRWSEVVGEKLATKCSPESIRGRTLVISVVSSAWAQELSFYKATMFFRLKPLLSEGTVVEDVHFYVGGSRSPEDPQRFDGSYFE